MGSKTGISWCHHTQNLWEGCEKISPGCKNCYAAAMNAWLHGGENWVPGGPRRTFRDAHYRQPLAWNKAAESAGERRRVFVNSISDFMEIHRDPATNAILHELRADFWTKTVPECPWLDFLILTKRIENAPRILPWISTRAQPPANVWIGATMEDDEHARKRWAMLRHVRAARTFVSYEPALGRIDWRSIMTGDEMPDLIIFGDESGRNRRDGELAWARETRDFCAERGIYFHFKQWCGADAEGVTGERNKKRVIHLPILDGVQHAEMPHG